MYVFLFLVEKLSNKSGHDQFEISLISHDFRVVLALSVVVICQRIISVVELFELRYDGM